MDKKTTTPWQQKIADLNGSGLTYAQIAEATDSHLSTIGSIATGQSASPRGDLALRLHTLHATRCKPKSTRKRKQAA